MSEELKRQMADRVVRAANESEDFLEAIGKFICSEASVQLTTYIKLRCLVRSKKGPTPTFISHIITGLEEHIKEMAGKEEGQKILDSLRLEEEAIWQISEILENPTVTPVVTPPSESIN